MDWIEITAKEPLFAQQFYVASAKLAKRLLKRMESQKSLLIPIGPLLVACAFDEVAEEECAPAQS